MPNLFASMMNEGMGALQESLGETVSVVRYKRNDADEGFLLVKWLLNSINGQEELKPSTMEVVGIETLKITGPAADLEAKSVRGYQRKAIVKIGELEYHIDPLTTVFGGSMVTLGLKRKPILAQNEMRNAGL